MIFLILKRAKILKIVFPSFPGRKNSEVIPNGSIESPKKDAKFSQNPGDFENFPEIPKKTVEVLQARGIISLFPVQYHSFKNIYNREDLIVRDLTGSGKTLAFSLPIVEYLRTNKLFKTG